MLRNNKSADSIRAVSLCKEHPGKMWSIKNKFLKPLLTNNKKLNFMQNNIKIYQNFIIKIAH